MSAISQKIDSIIKTGLHPTLKQEGFRKSSRTFRRGFDHCVQITNIQGSWTNYGDQGQFTMNLAVYFPEAAELHGLYSITNHPTISDCMIGVRIGRLMPVKRDYWWEVDSESNLDEISSDIKTQWQTHGKIWLENHSSFEGALTFCLDQKQLFWATIFSLILGRQADARQYLYEAIAKVPPNSEYLMHLQEWGRSKGIIE